MTTVSTEKAVVQCAKRGQELRGPADRGTIKLRCPACRAEFEFTPPRALRANEWFEKALDLFESERYEEALVCFQEARRFRHPHSERAIARCREKLGKTAHERLFAWGENAEEVCPPAVRSPFPGSTKHGGGIILVA